MPGPEGFAYEVRGSEVVISHHGRRATVLRGAAAAGFLADVEDDDLLGLFRVGQLGKPPRQRLRVLGFRLAHL